MHHVMGFKEMKLFFHKSIRSSQVHHNNFQFQRKFVNSRVKSTLYQEQHLAKEKKSNVSFEGFAMSIRIQSIR